MTKNAKETYVGICNVALRMYKKWSFNILISYKKFYIWIKWNSTNEFERDAEYLLYCIAHSEVLHYPTIGIESNAHFTFFLNRKHPY